MEFGRCRTIQYDPKVGLINEVSLDFDVARLYAASFDKGIVVVSDPTTGRIEREGIFAFEDQVPRPVPCIKVDNHRIAIAQPGGAVAVITNFKDKISNRVFRVLEGGFHHLSAGVLEWVPGVTNILISGGEDGDVLVWDTGSSRCIGILKGVVNEAITYLASDPKHHVLAGTSAGRILVWDVDLTALLASLHQHPISSPNVNPNVNPNHMSPTAIPFTPPTIHFARALLLPFSSTSSVQNILYDAHSHTCVGVATEGTVMKRFDVNSGRCLQVLKGHHAPITCMQWMKPEQQPSLLQPSSSTSSLFGGSDTTNTPQHRRTPVSASSPNSSLQLPSPIMTLSITEPWMLISGDKHGIVHVWDLGRTKMSVAATPLSPMQSFVETHTGAMNIPSNNTNNNHPSLLSTSPGLLSSSYLPTDSHSNGGEEELKPLRHLRGHLEGITQLACDALKIVTAAEDGHIRVWCAISGRNIRTLRVRQMRSVNQFNLNLNIPIHNNNININNNNNNNNNDELGNVIQIDRQNTPRILFMTMHKIIVTVNGQIKIWDFSPNPASETGKNKKHGKRKQLRHSVPFGTSPKQQIYKDMKNELKEFEVEMVAEEKYRKKLERLQGTSGPSMISPSSSYTNPVSASSLLFARSPDNAAVSAASGSSLSSRLGKPATSASATVSGLPGTANMTEEELVHYAMLLSIESHEREEEFRTVVESVDNRPSSKKGKAPASSASASTRHDDDDMVAGKFESDDEDFSSSSFSSSSFSDSADEGEIWEDYTSPTGKQQLKLTFGSGITTGTSRRRSSVSSSASGGSSVSGSLTSPKMIPYSAGSHHVGSSGASPLLSGAGIGIGAGMRSGSVDHHHHHHHPQSIAFPKFGSPPPPLPPSVLSSMMAAARSPPTHGNGASMMAAAVSSNNHPTPLSTSSSSRSIPIISKTSPTSPSVPTITGTSAPGPMVVNASASEYATLSSPPTGAAIEAASPTSSSRKRRSSRHRNRSGSSTRNADGTDETRRGRRRYSGSHYDVDEADRYESDDAEYFGSSTRRRSSSGFRPDGQPEYEKVSVVPRKSVLRDEDEELQYVLELSMVEK